MQQRPAGMVLGENVRRLRDRRGWSAATLAQRLAWSEDRLLALEAGTLDLDLDSLDRLSEALETTPHGLFDPACELIHHPVERRYG